MRRIVGIAVSFVVTACAFAWTAHSRLYETAMETAHELYWQRTAIARELAASPPAARHVLFLGDSTILSYPGSPSWPIRLAPRLRARGIATTLALAPGRDFFHHFCLLPAQLESAPELVVMVANLRLFGRDRRDGRSIDLCSHLPPDAWPGAVTLPWHDRGVTLLRVALTRLLERDTFEDWFLFAEGVRRQFSDALVLREERLPPADIRSPIVQATWRKIAAAYRRPIDARHPMVRMLEASVATARRRGARVLVVVAPVPLHQVMRQRGLSAPRFPERVAMLRQSVEGAGGEIVDLHDLLRRRGFRDGAGHYSPAGTVRMATAVSAEIHRMLMLPAPTPILLRPAGQR